MKTKNNKELKYNLITDISSPFKEALVYFQELVLDRTISQKDRMRYNLQLALAYRGVGKFAESKDMLASCDKYILAHGAIEEKTTVHLIRSMELLQGIKFQEALSTSVKALHLAREVKIPILELRCIVVCGRCCLRLLLYTEGMEYLTQGLTLAKELKDEKQILMFMYQLFEIKKELVSPLEALQDAEALMAYKKDMRQDKIDDMDVHIAQQTAWVSIEAGLIDKARYYTDTAINLKKMIAPNDALMGNLILLLATVSSREGNEQEMLLHTTAALELHNKEESPFGLIMAYIIRFEYYLSVHKTKEAKKNLDTAVAEAAKVNTALTNHKIDKAYLQYYEKTGDTAQELLYLKKIKSSDAKAQEQIMNHRIKHINAVQELELIEKKNKDLSKALNNKAQELNMAHHHLQQRNDLLNDLKETIGSLKKENTQREAIFQALFKKIDMVFNKEEIEREGFKEKFDATHIDFIRVLNRLYPRLSNAECRICALLHSGFNTKEIATLLSTTHRNIETHRLNIRKKMGLKREDNLQMILARVKA